jgi:hypothetical protein
MAIITVITGMLIMAGHTMHTIIIATTITGGTGNKKPRKLRGFFMLNPLFYAEIATLSLTTMMLGEFNGESSLPTQKILQGLLGKC